MTAKTKIQKDAAELCREVDKLMGVDKLPLRRFLQLTGMAITKDLSAITTFACIDGVSFIMTSKAMEIH